MTTLARRRCLLAATADDPCVRHPRGRARPIPAAARRWTAAPQPVRPPSWPCNGRRSPSRGWPRRAVLWPVVETTDFVEHHHLLDWMDALLTTDDGLVGVRPIVNYVDQLPPLRRRALLLSSPARPRGEIAAQFETAGPAVMLGQLDLRAAQALRPVPARDLEPARRSPVRRDRSEQRRRAGGAGDGAGRYGSDNLGAELRWSAAAPLSADRPRPRRSPASRLRRRPTSHGGPSVSTLYGLPPDACAALGLPPPCVDPAQMPGFYRGLRIARAGGGMVLDLRNPARDGSGVSLLVDGTFAQGLAGDPSRHATFTAETVLALGGTTACSWCGRRAAMVERLGAAPIPFEELITPSGQAGCAASPTGASAARAAWSAPPSTAGTSPRIWTRPCSPTSGRSRARASRASTGPLVPELRPRAAALQDPGRLLGGGRAQRHPDRLRARRRLAAAADDGGLLTQELPLALPTTQFLRTRARWVPGSGWHDS